VYCATCQSLQNLGLKWSIDSSAVTGEFPSLVTNEETELIQQRSTVCSHADKSGSILLGTCQRSQIYRDVTSVNVAHAIVYLADNFILFGVTLNSYLSSINISMCCQKRLSSTSDSVSAHSPSSQRGLWWSWSAVPCSRQLCQLRSVRCVETQLYSLSAAAHTVRWELLLHFAGFTGCQSSSGSNTRLRLLLSKFVRRLHQTIYII
jgi:hypothetical protein